MAPRRPTAFEVSFGEDEDGSGGDASSSSRSGSAYVFGFGGDSSSASASTSASGDGRASAAGVKRGREELMDGEGENEGGDDAPPKRMQKPPVAFYTSLQRQVPEREEMDGELDTAFDELSISSNSATSASTSKPVRVLNDFTVFDPRHRCELVTLDMLEASEDGVDREFEGAGYAVPYDGGDDEDEGQEDGAEEHDAGHREWEYVRLGAIMRYWVDYEKEFEPFYIETQCAWYILKQPSKEYRPFFEYFQRPRKIAQVLISKAESRRERWTYNKFMSWFAKQVDMFGRTYVRADLKASTNEILAALEEIDRQDEVLSHPMIIQALASSPRTTVISTSTSSSLRLSARTTLRSRRTHPRRRPADVASGNLDLFVLKPENQNRTVVTPEVSMLAQGFVFEELVVVGPRPVQPSRVRLEQERAAAHQELLRLIRRAKVGAMKNVEYKREDRMRVGSAFVKEVRVEGEVYKPGDFVLVPIGDNGKTKGPALPDDVATVKKTSKIPEFFWFAKIIYIKPAEGVVHVQWLEHGTGILFEELAGEQQLYLCDLCDTIPLTDLVTKVRVRFGKPDAAHPLPKGEYYYRFLVNNALSSFHTVDPTYRSFYTTAPPPDNCIICQLQAQQEQSKSPRSIKSPFGTTPPMPRSKSKSRPSAAASTAAAAAETETAPGVSFCDNNYHENDFVLYHWRAAEELGGGPARIGQITSITTPPRLREGFMVTVRLVGRIVDLEGKGVLPDDMYLDERHLYLTDEEVTIALEEIIRVCYVVTKQAAHSALEEWLAHSPDHFFVCFRFRTLSVTDWDRREEVGCERFFVCPVCTRERLQQFDHLREWRAGMVKGRGVLRTLDVFGGVGAFSGGLKEGCEGGMRVTHAVEISPSASKTFKHNSPDTLVFNQCANLVLQHAIKKYKGHETDPLYQLYDRSEHVPAPPRPGDIDMIVAGFPCQTHSGLNMYKVANDIKSNLILNALSWVDFMKPNYVYFENVPGFLQFTLNSVQASQHRVEGGITNGGLKLLVRAMTELGYQCRFALLQAGYYGAPQSRVRFFLIAARDGLPLPELPHPSHDFPKINACTIRLDLMIRKTIRPIRTTNGTAPLPRVRIRDSIWDLPRFDWKHPNPIRLSITQKAEARERERAGIQAFACDGRQGFCGPTGAPEYLHPPRTRYQALARRRTPRELQHFTKVLTPKRVERVLAIPLVSRADYRSLDAIHDQWQLNNPNSYLGRSGYKPGPYGRLGEDEWFPTTVTNMDPTAKQSRVLHPRDKRMVTVRELARSQGFPDSFYFVADKNRVVTMHRQIGNAVAWPTARALGRELMLAMYKKWVTDCDNAIVVEDEEDEGGHWSEGDVDMG